MYYATDYISPLGRVKLAADGEALIGLWPPGSGKCEGLAEPVFCGEEAGDIRTADCADGKRIPARRMGTSLRDSLWAGHHLWGDRKKNGGEDGKKQHVRPGGRRGGRPQSDLYHYPLPPGCRREREPDRVCRRD